MTFYIEKKIFKLKSQDHISLQLTNMTNILTLPSDIYYLIATRLTPQSIVRWSGCNKQLRMTLVSTTEISERIWKFWFQRGLSAVRPPHIHCEYPKRREEVNRYYQGYSWVYCQIKKDTLVAFDGPSKLRTVSLRLSSLYGYELMAIPLFQEDWTYNDIQMEAVMNLFEYEYYDIIDHPSVKPYISLIPVNEILDRGGIKAAYYLLNHRDNLQSYELTSIIYKLVKNDDFSLVETIHNNDLHLNSYAYHKAIKFNHPDMAHWLMTNRTPSFDAMLKATIKYECDELFNHVLAQRVTLDEVAQCHSVDMGLRHAFKYRQFKYFKPLIDFAHNAVKDFPKEAGIEFIKHEIRAFNSFINNPNLLYSRETLDLILPYTKPDYYSLIANAAMMRKLDLVEFFVQKCKETQI
jgi:hypothetical protein